MRVRRGAGTLRLARTRAHHSTTHLLIFNLCFSLGSIARNGSTLCLCVRARAKEVWGGEGVRARLTKQK